jgi:porphobilinogen synthase
MITRLRRLRTSALLREMVAETRLSKNMFVYPYFVLPGKNNTNDIDAMPGIKRFSGDLLVKDVEAGLKLGVNKVLLFGTGEEKADDGHTAFHEHSVVADAVALLKKNFGEDLFVITDVCLCAYTSHGHCGIIEHNHVHNDQTVNVLAKMALAHANAGADMVAPSDMMDGRVRAIRDLLDRNKMETTGIMSYSTKFASSYYGPFREAADSAPDASNVLKDRKTYQMDFRNGNEAVREALLDEQEGADVLMVKPALAYLDIVRRVKESTMLPLACYNVSGEYTMVKLAAQKGYLDEEKIVMENMMAFARAGADIIISYHTRDILKNIWL